MKKLILIITLILLAEPSFAEVAKIPEIIEFTTSDITKRTIGLIMIPFLFIATAISVLTGLAGVLVTVVALPVVITYYEAKDATLIAMENRFIETDLCPAAKDLKLDFTNSTTPKAYIVHNYEKNNYIKAKKFDYLFNTFNKLNNQPNYMCFNKDCLLGNNLAFGVWQPTKAYTYDNHSFIQLKKQIDDTKYITATTEFSNVLRSLSYNKHYVFKGADTNFAVRDLCPLLRRVAIHRLDYSLEI